MTAPVDRSALRDEMADVLQETYGDEIARTGGYVLYQTLADAVLVTGQVDIEQVRRLIAAATPGPLTVLVHEDGYVATVEAPGNSELAVVDTVADAFLIAAASELLPAMADEIEANRAELARLRAQVAAVEALAKLGDRYDEPWAESILVALKVTS